ncbi:MAG: hypothetical protein EPO28_12570 [Saprospiraceae bacterium]|nr:MAG: hypothetical protein EPO28_12570 [Saprospiraceae bacterium]
MLRFWWLFIIPLNLFCQSQTVNVEVFTRQHGLSSNYVTDIVLDNAGFLWVATTEGLNRYDGNSFTQFFVPGQTSALADEVTAMLLLPDGRLALATSGGLFFFDLHTHEFRRLEVERNRPDLAQFDNNFSCLMLDKGGRLWAGSWTGVHVLDARTGQFHQSYFAGESVLFKERLSFSQKLAPAPDGSVVVHAHFNHKENWLVPDFSKNKMTPASVRFPGFEASWPKEVSPPPGLILPAGLPEMKSFLQDRQHSFWGASDNGLYHFWPAEAAFQQYPALTDFLKKKKTVELVDALLSGQKLWLATTDGLIFYDLHTRQVGIFLPANYFTHPYCNRVWSIHSHSDGKLWIGCGCGYFWLDPNTLQAGRIDLPDKPPSFDQDNGVVQFEDSKGLIWMGLGNGNGLVRFDPALGKLHYYLPATRGGDFPLRHPMAIAEDGAGNLWFGTQRGGGLVCWNRGQDAFSVIHTGEIHGFDLDLIESMVADGQGHLWLGVLKAGLVRFDIREKRFTVFGRQKGLESTYIYRLAMDAGGKIWLSTEFGLHRFDPATERFDVFLQKDGLPDDYISFVKSTGDMMMAGCPGDFVFFKPAFFSKEQPAPPVFLTKILVEGNELKEPIGRNLRLRYLQNNIQFEFTAVDLLQGKNTRFSYRLEGIGDGWKDIGTLRNVSFANLPPGAYHFGLRAALPNGGWGQPAVLLDFTIRPPWWAAWWFRLSMAAVLALAAWGLYRFRIRQLLEVQQVRNEISRDLHDDIGTTLSNIEILSRMGQQRPDEPSYAKSFLEKIANETRQANETLHQIVWNINPANDEVAQLLARLTRHAAETLEAANIAMYLDAPESLPPVKIKLEKRRDLFLLFKEAMSNIVRHAGATAVHIKIEMKGKKLIMTIADNGKGFDTNTPTHGNGLQNMRQRMTKWGGEFEITSKNGEGTAVRLMLP